MPSRSAETYGCGVMSPRDPLDPETEEWLDQGVAAAPELTDRQCAELRLVFSEAGDDAPT
jgi:hypothetical protein